MAIPPTAVDIEEGLDPQEIKDFRIDATDSLEAGEKISDTPGDWSLVPLAAALALGLDIEPGGDYPDPALDINRIAVDFWAQVDPLYEGSEEFQGTGTPVPMEFTFFTDNVPPRKIQQTVLLTIVER